MSPQWCCAGLFRTAIWLEEDQDLQRKTGHYFNVPLKSDVPTESGVHVLLLPPNTTTSLSRPRHAVWHPLRGNNSTINTPFILFSGCNHGQKNDGLEQENPALFCGNKRRPGLVPVGVCHPSPVPLLGVKLPGVVCQSKRSNKDIMFKDWKIE